MQVDVDALWTDSSLASGKSRTARPLPLAVDDYSRKKSFFCDNRKIGIDWRAMQRDLIGRRHPTHPGWMWWQPAGPEQAGPAGTSGAAS